MAKGNWNPNVIKPRVRCRLCGGVILVKRGDVFVRLDGINPAHKSCADNHGKKYTVGMDIHPTYMASGLTPRVPDAAKPSDEFDRIPDYLNELSRRSG